MKAAFLVKKGSPHSAFEIRDTQQPQLDEGDVLIKVESFGLNFADVMARQGLYPDAPKFPGIVGYDVVGEVIEAKGSEALKLKGKRVVAMTRFGGYAELAKTTHLACAEISDDLPAAKAMAMAVQYVTAYYCAYEMVNLHKGDHVLIHSAAGGVGTALTQLAKLKECIVFGTTGSDEKFDYLKSIGVDHPINYKKSSYFDKVKAVLGESGVDVSFNSIGGKSVKQDKKLLAHGGRMVLFGMASRSGKKGGVFSTLGMVAKAGITSPMMYMLKSTGTIGVNMLRIADFQPKTMNRCLKAVVRLIEEGKLDPKVGGEFKINDLASAHELLESGKSVGKISVAW